ncbi:hypothetical protein A9R00_05620 [Oleispira antarctica]|uniref:Uncharacterized protein n=1 Tax=Oleispira antarctica TaxID=188908 RepID=A0A1Y5HTV9_OLEAN|nr:hypothetical protein A9R00_05620 [Oleispira antarctica]
MTLAIESLLAGETALDNAPKTELADGRLCVPQHYLSYNHTLKSVEALILDIEYDIRYPVFVGQEQAGLYIQVGVIGVDNYQNKTNATEAETKIVYGRKWRVEPQLPSSEIIQTVFLALKKAREHEVRELFRLQHNEKTTTPFNNHHDLPLLVRSEQRLQSSISNSSVSDFNQQLEQVLKSVSYDGRQFELLSFMKRPSGQYLIELVIKQEMKTYIGFFLNQLNINQFLHQLMQHFIDASDRHVDEHFRYCGFNRFSWNNSVAAIAEISAEVRQLHKDETLDNFHQHWQQTNYETDRSRIPNPAPGELWDKIHRQLKQFSPQEHTLPVNG